MFVLERLHAGRVKVVSHGEAEMERPASEHRVGQALLIGMIDADGFGRSKVAEDDGANGLGGSGQANERWMIGRKIELGQQDAGGQEESGAVNSHMARL